MNKQKTAIIITTIIMLSLIIIFALISFANATITYNIVMDNNTLGAFESIDYGVF